MSYDDPIGDGRWGSNRKPQSTRVEEERGSGRLGRRELSDMSEASIDRAFAREIEERDESVRRNDEGWLRGRELAEEYLLETGREVPFTVDQQGVTNAFETWVYERRARERAQREAQYETDLSAA